MVCKDLSYWIFNWIWDSYGGDCFAIEEGSNLYIQYAIKCYKGKMILL